MADRLSESLVPMVEKLNETVTHLNTEVGSIADLTQSISSIVEQLEKVIRLARITCDQPHSKAHKRFGRHNKRYEKVCS